MNQSLSALCVVLLSCWQQHCAAQFNVNTDFPGGSAVVVSIDAAKQSVHVQPQVRQERGWPCWWYFQLNGLSMGQRVSVTVSANATPFRSGRVLSHTWLLPDAASISGDNIHWQHTPKGAVDEKKAVYSFPATAETMWVAWGPPFLPAHAEDVLTRISRSLPDAEVFELARTRGGRPVNAIRIGAARGNPRMRSAIWIQGRQHAWEAGSSWVAHGFLTWIASDDPVAVELRDTTTICVVPIMDVDNVADGLGGKDAVPRDHNRDWDDHPVYPEVRAAQRAIEKLNASHQFELFVDLHNPGPRDRRPYFYAPRLDELPENQQRNYIRWNEIAKTQIEHLESEYRFTSYIKTSEELNRVSKNWVRNHTSPDAVSLTLETSWNRAQGTQRGYQKVGEQLGLTIARYLSADVD